MQLTAQLFLCGFYATILLLPVQSFSVKSVSKIKTFYFGGGCFWAPEDNLRGIPGITSTSVGYCGDDTPLKSPPSYDKVCSGRTRLVEAVRVEYDTTKLSFEDMLSLFAKVNTAKWDNKRQYRGIIFTSSDEEAQIASKFLKENEGVVAELEPMSNIFYTAEKYHQDYWAKWRLRLPSLVALLFVIGTYGDDWFGVGISQKVYNYIIYGFVFLTLVERRFFTDQNAILVKDSDNKD